MVVVFFFFLKLNIFETIGFFFLNSIKILLSKCTNTYIKKRKAFKWLMVKLINKKYKHKVYLKRKLSYLVFYFLLLKFFFATYSKVSLIAISLNFYYINTFLCSK